MSAPLFVFVVVLVAYLLGSLVGVWIVGRYLASGWRERGGSFWRWFFHGSIVE